jgi:hypothetical protein
VRTSNPTYYHEVCNTAIILKKKEQAWDQRDPGNMAECEQYF